MFYEGNLVEEGVIRKFIFLPNYTEHYIRK
jgi:hypothetical protein